MWISSLSHEMKQVSTLFIITHTNRWHANSDQKKHAQLHSEQDIHNGFLTFNLHDFLHMFQQIINRIIFYYKFLPSDAIASLDCN